jgi:hypothetical protein
LNPILNPISGIWYIPISGYPILYPISGIWYIPISGYPILNPILNPISVLYHADIGIPDSDIDPDVDPDIGYLIYSQYRFLMSRYRVTPDIGTLYRDHRSRYRETPDCGTTKIYRYRVHNSRYPENPDIRYPDIRKIRISGIPISKKKPISGLSRIQMLTK